MNATSEQPLPISMPVKVEAIPASGQTVDFAPDAAARAGLARLLDVLSVDALTARLTAMREGARVRVTGKFEACVTQACVVTLEPVEGVVSDTVEIVYAPAEEAEAAAKAAGFPADGEDLEEVDMAAIDLEMLNDPDALPDPIAPDGTIDLGQALYESIAVGLDPYPRKPGAVFEPPAEPEGFGSPFGALAALKKPN